MSHRGSMRCQSDKSNRTHKLRCRIVSPRRSTAVRFSPVLWNLVVWEYRAAAASGCGGSGSPRAPQVSSGGTAYTDEVDAEPDGLTHDLRFTEAGLCFIAQL